MGVLVERTSRLVLLARMDDATAASALAGFSAKLNSIAEPMRQSLTYDQGKEMMRHKELAAATGLRVYFCDPHSPWQKPTCENTNGLLRDYLPKGTDLSVFTQKELDAIADSMNTRPRQTLGWDTPSENSSAGSLLSPRSFGHTGFTGTSMWMDPDRNLFVVLLTNRVHPTRENNAIREVRRAVADAVVHGLANP